jgi:hypothetical protein
MGVGVLGLVGSVGTLASFTTSTSNPANDFSVGTLLLTDTTNFSTVSGTLNAGGSGNAPNQTGTDPRAGTDCGTAVVSSVCRSLIKSVNVASSGIEAGQYLRTTATITNAGTLPATVAFQVQNVQTSTGGGSTPCPADIAGTGSPGVTGAQLTTGANTSSNFGGPQPLTGCLDLGKALRITIQDTGGAGLQCVFGNDINGGGNGSNLLQAPVSGAFGAGGSYTVFTASGPKLGTGSGSCDDLSQAGLLGRPTPVLPGANPKNTFGVQGSPTSNTSFAGLSGATTLVFIPGGGSTQSVINSAALGGNLNGIPQWAAGETHNFIVTVALPDTGTTLVTDHNSDTLKVGNDNPYEGGSVSFDLYWFAVQ